MLGTILAGCVKALSSTWRVVGRGDQPTDPPPVTVPPLRYLSPEGQSREYGRGNGSTCGASLSRCAGFLLSRTRSYARVGVSHTLST